MSSSPSSFPFLTQMHELPLRPKRIVVAITGATGIIYGIRVLQAIQKLEGVESHLVLSTPAKQTIAYESDWSVDEIKALADVVHSNKDIGASLASGSFKTDGMVVVPCSMHTLACIAQGIADTLIFRAADVMLKERRSLVLCVRETPFHYGHLKNMLRVTSMGAIVAPPVPAFYDQPQSIDDLVNHTVGRLLDLLDLEHNLIRRWKDSDPP